ncbi:uncharacterized protein [Typha angustifolia]|uniref:uncharacterized protein n=1 Tax=Typha angustifolia TaxID=59011 RepID=UPI003C2C51B8
MAEEEIGGVFQSLLPPKLEDAGLEDCALPPESIIEAFSRAAISIKSRFTEEEDDEEKEGGCVQDPRPSNGEIADSLVGGGGGSKTLPVCGGGGVGSGVEGRKGSGDEVVVVGVDEEEMEGDRVVVVGGEQEEQDVGGKRSCVEGVGVGILGGKKKLGLSEEKEDEGEGESDGGNRKPILVEDLI